MAFHSYAWRRITGVLDPWARASDEGFQLVQSFVAFGNGGFLGRGLGDGRQKLFYLPEAHTDFILSVVAEEIGLVGVLLVLGGFAALLVAGLRIAGRARDPFPLLAAFGLTMLLTVPAAVNAAVVMGLVWLCESYEIQGKDLTYLAFLLTVAAGALMVSRFPYYSFKDFDMRERVPFVALLAVVLVFVFLSIETATVLFSRTAGLAVSLEPQAHAPDRILGRDNRRSGRRELNFCLARRPGLAIFRNMQPRYAKIRSYSKARLDLLPAYLLLSLLLVLLLP